MTAYRKCFILPHKQLSPHQPKEEKRKEARARKLLGRVCIKARMMFAPCPTGRLDVASINSWHQMGWCLVLTQKVVLQMRYSAEDHGKLQTLSVTKKGLLLPKVNWTCQLMPRSSKKAKPSGSLLSVNTGFPNACAVLRRLKQGEGMLPSQGRFPVQSHPNVPPH